MNSAIEVPKHFDNEFFFMSKEVELQVLFLIAQQSPSDTLKSFHAKNCEKVHKKNLVFANLSTSCGKNFQQVPIET